MCILTHLCNLRQNKQLRNRKNLLKQRIWTDVYQGAKLINGEYQKMEVHNVGLFISTRKFCLLQW